MDKLCWEPGCEEEVAYHCGFCELHTCHRCEQEGFDHDPLIMQENDLPFHESCWADYCDEEGEAAMYRAANPESTGEHGC